MNFRKTLGVAVLGFSLVSPALAQQASTGATPVDLSQTISLNLASTANTTVVPVPPGSAVFRFTTLGITGSGGAVSVSGQTLSGVWSPLTLNNSTPALTGGNTTIDANNNWVAAYGFTALRFNVVVAGTGTVTITTNFSNSPPTAVSLLPPLSGIFGSFNVAGNASTATHVTGTTSATAGVSSTVVAAAGVTKGIVLQNTCGTAEWFSSSVTVGTALTATNSMTLAPGASFITPDWYPISGAWTIASATAVACTYVADYK